MTTFPIITKLGGREAVSDALTASGTATTRDQVRMWEARGRIPGDSQVALMRLAETRNIKYRAADFDSEHPTASRRRRAA